MTLHPCKPFVLVGMMGAGKTTIGKRLADRWGCPFIDSDERICEETHKTIAQLFDEQGEGHFRTIEARVILALLADEQPPYVLAVGGGAFMTGQVRDRLLQDTYTVWLDVPLTVLQTRLAKSKAERPLHDDLETLYHARQGTYQKAHHRIDVGTMTSQRIIDTIIHTAETYA
ncbi:MAG: shikimate kinase [Alphaproteobacteria bacterium GM202ARS2]|nr:shikimate kinase [Alphaproteobacteria bacterium GM202ARS2]